MDLLSRETGLEFLEKVGVKGGEELLSQDRLKFLTSVVRALQEHLPFQCVSVMAQAEGEHHVPSLEEVVEAGLTLEGGLCFTLNIFACLLLRALHLDAHTLDGSYSGLGDNHSHVIVLVRNLRYPDDSYIVDIGCGFPTLDPVPIAALPVQYYQAGLEFRFAWLDDTTVIRLHRSGDDDPVPGEKPVMRENWRQVFHFTLNPVDFEYFRPHMLEIYTDTENEDYLLSIRAIRFPPPGSVPGRSFSTVDQPATATHKDEALICGNEKKRDTEKEGSSDDEERVMVAMKDQSLLLGKMDAAKKTKVSQGDWAATIKHFFPTIPPTKVDRALQRMADLGKVIMVNSDKDC